MEPPILPGHAGTRCPLLIGIGQIVAAIGGPCFLKGLEGLSRPASLGSAQASLVGSAKGVDILHDGEGWIEEIAVVTKQHRLIAATRTTATQGTAQGVDGHLQAACASHSIRLWPETVD